METVKTLGWPGALRVTLANSAQVAASTLLTLPVRALFKVFGLTRAVSKRVKKALSRSQRPEGGFPFRLTRKAKKTKEKYGGGTYGL